MTVATAEQEALAVASGANGEIDWEVLNAEQERRLAERHKQLLSDARAIFRTMDGWSEIKTQEDWECTVQQADRDFDNGTFLIDRLGAERYIDPPLIAVLLRLRRRLIE